MGKSLALALPFIVAGILFLFWVCYQMGRQKGRSEAPQREVWVGTRLLKQVDDLLHQLVMRSDATLSDILSDQTRKEINTWRSDYLKAKNK